jgi:hypothetical protein
MLVAAGAMGAACTASVIGGASSTAASSSGGGHGGASSTAASSSGGGHGGASSTAGSSGGGASSSSGQASSSTGSNGGACSHPICTTGIPLDAGCDPCATKICASDGYCCEYAWDQKCAGEDMQVYCGETCGGASSSSGGTGGTSASASSSAGAPWGGCNVDGDTHCPYGGSPPWLCCDHGCYEDHWMLGGYCGAKCPYGVLMESAGWGCFNPCTSGAGPAQCTEGACINGAWQQCAPGLTACSNCTLCTDTQSDTSNCGGCGLACPTGASCVGGHCQACAALGPHFAECGGGEKDYCADLGSDTHNCGACNTVCTPTGAPCVDGVCM